MNISNPPGTVDIKDPRIRITFADVAMRIARDGPMYGVIVLVGVLALKGTTTALESILGAAFALLARSRPPAENDKGTIIRSGLMTFATGVAALGCLHLLSACR